MSQNIRLSLLATALLLSLTSCAMQSQWREASPATVQQQDLDNFPYHPLVYHIDLCVLSYQLYSQSLVWPFDPYYEERNNWDWDRTKFTSTVRDWAATTGAEQSKRHPGLSGFRGPGILNGFPDNPSHDPIIYRYDRIHPWSDTLTNPAGKWVEYLTPSTVTGQIRDVYVCYRPTGKPEGSVTIDRLSPQKRESAPGARDVLLAFEGGTGDKGETGQPASQSLMGFVLLRHSPNSNSYDVHITFRGSRSGSAPRAMFQGLSHTDAKGNPDWITDMGYSRLMPEEGASHITTTGQVSRGFAHSMESILPQTIRCLQKVSSLKGGRQPNRIYVTGHSLGGALAQHFTSAMLLGNRFGPTGSGPAMPSSLRRWPWKEIKLITFGAPRAGDAEWARTLTGQGLDSEVFSTRLDPYDRSALPVAHPSIIPRLTDKSRPAGYRVLLVQDPIGTAKVTGGKHVGKSIYVDHPNITKLFKAWSLKSHEPNKTRDLMIESLADPRIPQTAWRYHEMSSLNPSRNEDKRGSIEEYQKLKSSILQYYRTRHQHFDEAAFNRDFALYLKLLQDQ